MKTNVFSICVPVVVHSKHLFFLILLCCLRIFSVCFLVDFHQYALPCVFKLFLLFCHPANGRFLNYGLHPQIIIFCRYFTVNHPAIGVCIGPSDVRNTKWADESHPIMSIVQMCKYPTKLWFLARVS